MICHGNTDSHFTEIMPGPATIMRQKKYSNWRPPNTPMEHFNFNSKPWHCSTIQSFKGTATFNPILQLFENWPGYVPLLLVVPQLDSQLLLALVFFQLGCQIEFNTAELFLSFTANQNFKAEPFSFKTDTSRFFWKRMVGGKFKKFNFEKNENHLKSGKWTCMSRFSKLCSYVTSHARSQMHKALQVWLETKTRPYLNRSWSPDCYLLAPCRGDALGMA